MNIRYIRLESNGSNVNRDDHYVEVQALDSGNVNRALGRGVYDHSVAPLAGYGNESMITDGNTVSNNYVAYAPGNVVTWIIIDLGAIYDITSLKVWHYWADGRIYYSVKFLVSTDNSSWETVFDSSVDGVYQESSAGKTISLPPASSTYTVRFNDGSGNTETQEIEVEVATSLETPFAKRNYKLLGWDTSSAGTTVVYTPGQSVTDIAQQGQIIDLYAVWRKSWAYILMDDNGDYYSATQSGAAQTLVPLTGISTLTAAVFYGQGFQFLPNNTILRSLSEPTIYLWADDPWTFMDGDVNAVPYPQAIKTEVDLSAAHIIGIDEFLISYTGNINVGYTYDGTAPSTTMTVAAFLALDPDDIYDGLTSAKKLYIYFYLEDEDAVLTRLTVYYKRRTFH